MPDTGLPTKTMPGIKVKCEGLFHVDTRIFMHGNFLDIKFYHILSLKYILV